MSKGRVISLILSSRFVVRLTEAVEFDIEKIISFKDMFTVFHLYTVINTSTETITGKCLY